MSVHGDNADDVTRIENLEGLFVELDRTEESGESHDYAHLARTLHMTEDDVRNAAFARSTLRALSGPTLDADHPRILGDYELTHELGRGGMGVVYRARHGSLGHYVAIKVLPSGQGASARQRERFGLEARATARLRHPNIVAIHDVGRADGCDYLVMDLVEGASLHDALEHGPLEPRDAAVVCQKLADALHYAHDHMILHRDVKPANVLRDADGEPLLTDFGLAKFLDSSPGRHLTQTGMILGTPAYMPPEQARSGVVDARSDVYSLGATLYALLVGEAPFNGHTFVELMGSVLNLEPDSPRKRRPAIDADLDRICLKCLEKEPAQRYQSARALGNDLRRYLAGETIEARSPTALDRAEKWVRRNRTTARVLASSVASLVVIAVVAGAWVGQADAVARRQLVVEARQQAEAAQATSLDRFATHPEERISLALRALQRTQRWFDLAPEDPAAAQRLCAAAFALGELALADEEWALAREAFSQAEGLGVDDAGARAAVARVKRIRHAEAKRRTDEVAVLLTRAERGELARESDGLLDAVFAITRYPDAETIALLGSRLDRVTADLRAASDLAPDATLKTLAARQREAVGQGRLDLARLCCDALGRIGEPDGAVGPLSRYLRAEADPLRATPAALALCRLGGDVAVGEVRAGFDRFGVNGLYGQRLGRALVGRSEGQLQTESNDADALLNRGLALYQQGDFRGAIAIYEQALELYPKNAVVWASRGNCHNRLGDVKQAIEDFDRAIDLAPLFASAWSNRGGAYMALGKLAEAQRDIERAVALAPNDPMGLTLQSQVAGAGGDYPAALDAAERALKSEPGFAAAWAARGLAKKGGGDLPGAVRDYTRTLELDPRDTTTWVNRGNAYLLMNQHGRAISDYNRAIELQPGYRLPVRNRAVAREKQGDLIGAVADLGRALELDDDAPTRVLRGTHLRTLGKPDAARRDFERALELDPRHGRAWFQRARSKSILGDLPGAISDSGRAIELEPGFAAAWNNRANARLRAGDPKGALADFDEALRLAPNFVDALLNRGGALVAAGRTLDAIDDFSRAIEIDPTDALPWVNRGLAKQTLGDVPGAIADLEQFLKLGADHPRAGVIRTFVERLRRQ